MFFFAKWCLCKSIRVFKHLCAKPSLCWKHLCLRAPVCRSLPVSVHLSVSTSVSKGLFLSKKLWLWILNPNTCYSTTHLLFYRKRIRDHSDHSSRMFQSWSLWRLGRRENLAKLKVIGCQTDGKHLRLAYMVRSPKMEFRVENPNIKHVRKAPYGKKWW